MITQSYSSPMLAEGIGAFTSQFKKGGMTRKNTKKKLSSKDLEFIEAYANGGSVGDNLIKKDTYEVGDKIKFIDSFRKEEKEGNIYQINEVGNYVVTYGSGITAGMRSVNADEVVGAYPKEEPKKKRFGLFADGGKTMDQVWDDYRIADQYEGKKPEDIWFRLSKSQRKHLLLDHANIPSGDVSPYIGDDTKFDELPQFIKQIVRKHFAEGQYAKGGPVKHNYSSARTQGRDNQDLEEELKAYAGKNYNNLTAEERRQIISDMQKFAKGGEVGKIRGGIRYVEGAELEWHGVMSFNVADYGETEAERKAYNYIQDSIKYWNGELNENDFIVRKSSDGKDYKGSYVVYRQFPKYAKGGTTDPKPSAQDILKRLGYSIPQSEEMQEEEPKIIRGWVDDEPYYFAKGGMSKDDSPKVYIADLTAYNNGQLIGKWFDLTDYSDGAELMADVQKMLDEQTKKDKYGDVHEEWAVHDYENFPSEFYSEYMGEADFDKLIQLINDAEDSDLPFDVIVKAMADLGRDELSEVKEAYFGSVPASMGNEWRDFAHEYVDMVGGISGVSNANYYFDYESFGSDERINMGGEAEEEMGYENLSDTELGEQLVEEVGGVEGLGESTIDMYFDYDKFGRELQYDFTAIRGEDGDYYFFNSNFKKGGKLKGNPDPEDDGEYQLSEEEKKIIRGYVDDEPYYFAEGGEVTADEKRKSLKSNAKLKF